MSVSKMIMGQAANQYVAPTYVENVFSTYLYDGSSSAQTITNGIDLSGEGGMVWGKARSTAEKNWLVDSERGKGSNNNFVYIESSETTANIDEASRSLSSFNSNGFTFQAGTDAQFNNSSHDYVSWTFRKAEKFFDVVTYTGTGSTQNINHSLGSVPGMMIVKKYVGSTTRWSVYHRSLGTGKFLNLDDTAAVVTQSDHWQTAPTATQFTVETNGNVNNSGDSYVAYLFAHNDGDGDFGVTNDQDIIKCGSYTGNSNSTGPEINLGFEPQWLMIKRASNTGGWFVIDTMRGWTSSTESDPFLRFDSNQEEYENAYLKPLATGFQPKTTSSAINYSGDTYIYMAIRRPMAIPTSATDVFSTELQNAGGTYTKTTGFVADMIIQTDRSGAAGVHRPYDRLRGGSKYLETSSTSAEASGGTMQFDNNTGYTGVTSLNTVDWVWKRAPSYFDVVAYTGTGSTHNVSHNLGVVPEMMWVKRRDTSYGWYVYHKDIGNTKYLALENTDAEATGTGAWDSTTPTSSVFTVGTQHRTNQSGGTFIAYLFATVAGVSKVGSYTGTGNNIDIDCGFSSGARFVLIKRRDTSVGGSWWVIDTVRGLTSNNDPIIRLDNNDAEYTQFNPLTPLSSGFTVASTATADFNASGGSYIFYAIS